MGKHFVPRKYLKGFAATEASSEKPLIWQFDKQTQQFSNAPLSIAKVAQQRDFYDEPTEKQITDLVETPGNAVLDKLRSGEFKLSDEERMSFSVYAATMVSRVPKHRRRGHSLAPQALAEVTSELRAFIKAARDDGVLDAELADRRLAEADAAEAKISAVLPEEVLERIESPWPTEDLVALIFNLQWRFLTSCGSHRFVTSDDPAFFFECWGLANKQSEFTFPISSDLTIHGCWTPVRTKSDLVQTSSQFVKEVNRRMIIGASRFVFCHAPLPWVAKISPKAVQNLNRFVF